MSKKNKEREPWEDWDCSPTLKAALTRVQGLIDEEKKTYQELWYAKYVSTSFTYEGKNYVLTPGLFDISEAFMEHMQGSIDAILAEIRCTNIKSVGMMD